MLFDTSCFKNLLLTPGEVHLATMRFFFFRKFAHPHFCTVFSTICGTVVEENEETQGDRNLFFGTPWPILRLRGSKFRFGICVTKTAGFTTCCLSLWCRRCLWRVSSSRSYCDIFHWRAYLIKKGSQFVVFTLISSSTPHFLRQFTGHLKSGCLERREKEEARNSGAQGVAATLYINMNTQKTQRGNTTQQHNMTTHHQSAAQPQPQPRTTLKWATDTRLFLSQQRVLQRQSSV